MLIRDAIGIDPDSQQYVCMYVKAEDWKTERKAFPVTTSGLDNLIEWTRSKNDPIIAIEGSNGQSKPLEKVLRKESMTYYSFKARDVEQKRKSQLPAGKNNEKDAHAAALLALEREMNGSLEKWRRVYPVDSELQTITRKYESVSGRITEEISGLWKLLCEASPDVYLFLSGKNMETDNRRNVLNSAGVLNLLCNCPDLSQWRRLSAEKMKELMGGGSYRGRDKTIAGLQVIAQRILGVAGPISMMIRQSAENIILLKGHKEEMKKILDNLAESREAVRVLAYDESNGNGLKGIGVITASTMIAEIIHINRFVKEDSLALYAGFGMVEDETGKKNRGERKKMKHTHDYNRRLKNAFMNAAKNFVHWNPDHHISGMHRNLIKNGMSRLEANKRVARALVRKIFRILKDYESENIRKMEENGVAKVG